MQSEFKYHHRNLAVYLLPAEQMYVRDTSLFLKLQMILLSILVVL